MENERLLRVLNAMNELREVNKLEIDEGNGNTLVRSAIDGLAWEICPCIFKDFLADVKIQQYLEANYRRYVDRK